MESELVGLIAAAGPGTRLYPEARKKTKVLLTVDGRSLLARNVDIMSRHMGIRTLFIITGKNRECIEQELSHGAYRDLTIRYIENSEPEKGLAHGVSLAGPHISGTFCLMLGDELYLDSSHEALAHSAHDDFSAVCLVKPGANPREIRKNYAVEIKDNRVVALREKPQVVTNDILGCGTFLLKPDIFEAIRLTAPSVRTGKVELIDALDLLIRQGKTVLPFFSSGTYVNVNTADDLNQANHAVRTEKFEEKRISLVIPSFNEEDSIGHVIDDFKNKVHEIIVADNQSSDSTAEIARRRGAKVYSAALRGYGHAIRYGMDKAEGDILVITEADGSFKARDLGKLLEYMKDADMVLGTRTTKQMIQQGANMTLFLRFGNAAVAKIIEVLWWSRHEPRLTDVGCTFRAIWADAYHRIKDDLNEDGPSFSPEMIIEPIRHYQRIIEIPVSYHGRIGGESKHSGNLKASLRTGLSMLYLIFRKKLRSVVIDDILPFFTNGKRKG